MKFLQKERSFSCRRYCGQEFGRRKSYSRWLSTQTTVMPAASDWNENELVSSSGVSISWLSSKATKVSAPFGARKATTTRTTSTANAPAGAKNRSHQDDAAPSDCSVACLLSSLSICRWIFDQ